MKAPIRGKGDVRRYLPSQWSGWSQMELRPKTMFTDVPAGKIAINWLMIATDVSRQHRVQLEGVDILQVRNGLFVSDRSIYNACSLLEQLKTPAQKDAALPGG